MIHQLPSRPAYLRIKVGRKLKDMGAVPIKNAVYVMPAGVGADEAFAKLHKDISRSGGDALVCEARFLKGLTDIAVRALFDSACDADYEKVVRDGRKLLNEGRVTKGNIVRLRRRYDEIARVDFFGAHGRQNADGVFGDLERRLNKHADVQRSRAPTGLTTQGLKNRIWVTRKHIHVDRIASAWLIRRFIDPNAKFRFVNPKTYKVQRDHIRFDMADAEFTHEGTDCTFETLVRRAELTSDPALRAIAEIIHDLDVDEGKFGRPEVAGVGAMISGVCTATANDEDRLRLGGLGLDHFYSYFSKV